MAKDVQQRTPSSSSKPEVEQLDQIRSSTNTATTTVTNDTELKQRLEVSAKAENPLSGLQSDELIRRAEDYCTAHGFITEEDRRIFRLGALIAGNDMQWDTVEGLTADEIAGLEYERDHPYKSLNSTLIGLNVVCVSTP